MRRNWVRQFERHKAAAREKLAIVKQGSLGSERRGELLEGVRDILGQMEKIASKDMLRTEAARTLNPALRRLRTVLTHSSKKVKKAGGFARLAGSKKRIYEEVFSLIYDCSQNQTAAKILIDRILSEIKR
jgi:molecular chaperone HtpG